MAGPEDNDEDDDDDEDEDEDGVDGDDDDEEGGDDNDEGDITQDGGQRQVKCQNYGCCLAGHFLFREGGSAAALRPSCLSKDLACHG